MINGDSNTLQCNQKFSSAIVSHINTLNERMQVQILKLTLLERYS